MLTSMLLSVFTLAVVALYYFEKKDHKKTHDNAAIIMRDSSMTARQHLAAQLKQIKRLKSKIRGRYHNTFHNKSHRSRQALHDQIDLIERVNMKLNSRLS